MSELAVRVDDRMVAVHESGDPGGAPLIHFHGTPGSRLETAFGADLAAEAGVRVIGFDRPGYGRSDAGPVSLAGVVRDVELIADHLELGQFAVSAWSGGAAFALATAAALGGRVTRVGISGGLAPFDLMPGARASLTPDDLEALACLPGAPDRAAELFHSGNSGTLDAMLSVRDDESAPWIGWMFAESDAAVITDPAARRALHENFREALRQGTHAIAWDNVAFVGPWGFPLDDVSAPVHLWYGERDAMASPANGQWLADHLPAAQLTVYPEEGHLLPLSHWDEMLRRLTAPL